MARASRFALLSVACVGCWFDIADIDSSSTQTSSSAGGAPATTSSSSGGQGGTAGVASGAGGHGGRVAGGAGGEGEMGGSGGSAPEPPPFQSCEPLGYLGTCAGPAAELLFYWNEDYDNGNPVCEHQAVSEVCLINDCSLDDTECAVNATCSDAQCGALPATFINCPDTYTPAGACLHNVAIRELSATDCEFRDCSLVAGWECRGPSDGELSADCFPPP